MRRDELLNIVSLGEDSASQFKADARNADSLASEMAAFANSAGGLILIGVADDGMSPGLSKGLLPYHGLGSGIKRALGNWPAIDFNDDHDGRLFTVTVHRKPVEELALVDKAALRAQINGQIKGQSDLIIDLLSAVRANPSADYASLAQELGVSEATVKRHIQKLKQQGGLRRIGSRKTGHWEITE